VNARQDPVTSEPATPRACTSRMFTPNYADQIGALEAGSWPRFPLRIWIDAATVHDEDEMQGLKRGLSSWSEATAGILAVEFTANRMRAQIEVQMVDRLPGGGSKLLMLGLSTIQTEGEQTITSAYLKIVRASPSILRAIGNSGNPQMTRALLTQRTAAHEMGHVLLGASNLHPAESRSILQEDNITVLRPSLVDINTVKAKYCALF
jgi:hypothetical protein